MTAYGSRVRLARAAPLVPRSDSAGVKLLRVPKRIPLSRLDAHPLTADAEAVAGFEWASPEIGTRHRIGGEPDGVPESEYMRHERPRPGTGVLAR